MEMDKAFFHRIIFSTFTNHVMLFWWIYMMILWITLLAAIVEEHVDRPIVARDNEPLADVRSYQSIQ